MNLDAWCKLSEDERNSRRLAWSEPNDEFYPDAHRLLTEACERFTSAHGDHPQVYHVAAWHWTGHKHIRTPIRTYFEPTIAVLTALRAPQRIESLPDRFMTFAVVQDQIEDQRQATIQEWRDLATHVFDLPTQRVDELVERYADGLCGRDPWFYHETAVYHFLPHAIPHDLHPAIGHRFDDLASELQHAIESNDSLTDPESETDWMSIREDVHRILRNVSPRGR
ncbi:MAG: hypothetical protein WBD31_00985 [Rubripirellula sp.]